MWNDDWRNELKEKITKSGKDFVNVEIQRMT